MLLSCIRNDSTENIKINNSSKEDLVNSIASTDLLITWMYPFCSMASTHTHTLTERRNLLSISEIAFIADCCAVKLEFRSFYLERWIEANTKVSCFFLFFVAITFSFFQPPLDFSSIRSENCILKVCLFFALSLYLLLPLFLDPTVECIFLKLSRRFILSHNS